jgi:hypothetical protein
MLTTEINAARQPVVFERGGEVFANSRDVAASHTTPSNGGLH